MTDTGLEDLEKKRNTLLKQLSECDSALTTMSHPPSQGSSHQEIVDHEMEAEQYAAKFLETMAAHLVTSSNEETPPEENAHVMPKRPSHESNTLSPAPFLPPKIAPDESVQLSGRTSYFRCRELSFTTDFELSIKFFDWHSGKKIRNSIQVAPGTKIQVFPRLKVIWINRTRCNFEFGGHIQPILGNVWIDPIKVKLSTDTHPPKFVQCHSLIFKMDTIVPTASLVTMIQTVTLVNPYADIVVKNKDKIPVYNLPPPGNSNAGEHLVKQLGKSHVSAGSKINLVTNEFTNRYGEPIFFANTSHFGPPYQQNKESVVRFEVETIGGEKKVVFAQIFRILPPNFYQFDDKPARSNTSPLLPEGFVLTRDDTESAPQPAKESEKEPAKESEKEPAKKSESSRSKRKAESDTDSRSKRLCSSEKTTIKSTFKFNNTIAPSESMTTVLQVLATIIGDRDAVDIRVRHPSLDDKEKNKFTFNNTIAKSESISTVLQTLAVIVEGKDEVDIRITRK